MGPRSGARSGIKQPLLPRPTRRRAHELKPVVQSGGAVAHMANLPLSTNILTLTIMATKMPFVGRG